MSSTILVGDCRDILPTLDAGSVQVCVTSPPYFGLRDYGTGKWDGGDPECDHAPDRAPRTGRERSGLTGSLTYNDSRDMPYRDVCGKCGATRQDRQIGLELTVDAYVAELVTVFREVRRVLRDDGTVWLNLGDSYTSSGIRGDTRGGFNQRYFGKGTPGKQAETANHVPPSTVPNGLKPKDLIGIPWRVAFALQSDGWYLRQDIIWAKPNPMPESVTDRCTKSHEYMFLLTKSARYYYDAKAIAEQSIKGDAGAGMRNYRPGTDGNQRKHEGQTEVPDRSIRNKRSVWTIATQPTKDAHFATFPEALVEPCILAGSRDGDTVLDPFAGSGTTLRVANRLGRQSVGIELNPAYVPMIERRTSQQGMVMPV